MLADFDAVIVAAAFEFCEAKYLLQVAARSICSMVSRTWFKISLLLIFFRSRAKLALK